MYREFLKSKIHRAKVTEANADYMGSITIDSRLMEAAEINPYEKVQVVDVANGARLWTYAIAGEKDSGMICLNGAAARLISEGDNIIIISYCSLTENEIESHIPKVVFVKEGNKLAKVEEYSKIFDIC